jgi:hypothetical protein
MEDALKARIAEEQGNLVFFHVILSAAAILAKERHSGGAFRPAPGPRLTQGGLYCVTQTKSAPPLQIILTEAAGTP